MTDDKISEVKDLEFSEQLPLRTEIVILKADNQKQLKLNWVITEKIGTGYISKSVSNIINGHKLVLCTLVE